MQGTASSSTPSGAASQQGKNFSLVKTLVAPSPVDTRPPPAASSSSCPDDEAPDLTSYICHMHRSPPLPQAIGSTTEILAAADSTHSLCLLSRQTLEVIGRISGHEDTISGVAFGKSNPALLWSSSHDGTVRCWDLRTQKQACSFDAKGAPVFSFDTGGDGELVLAAGSKENILFWDLRAVKPQQTTYPFALTFTESHTDDITKVRFHPFVANKLFTGSIDGLICLFDTTKGNEEDSLLSVISVEKPVDNFGFFGPAGGDLYVISTDQMLSLWNIDQGEPLAKLEDSRKALENTLPIDYLVDCHYDSQANALYLVSGTYSGNMDILLAEQSGIKPLYQLHGGHSAVIRCFDWNVAAKNIVTGGEDARICLWALSE